MHLFLIFALTFTLSAQQNAMGEKHQVRAITVPFQIHIPGGLKPKMTFIIRGFVPRIDSSFQINFVAGSDIALHINPRLNEGAVVRNSFLQGSWGPEERDLPFNPFKSGKFFNLSITCGKYQFSVYANDEFLFSYTHRYTDFPRINGLEMKGDVILSYLHY